MIHRRCKPLIISIQGTAGSRYSNCFHYDAYEISGFLRLAASPSAAQSNSSVRRSKRATIERRRDDNSVPFQALRHRHPSKHCLQRATILHYFYQQASALKENKWVLPRMSKPFYLLIVSLHQRSITLAYFVEKLLDCTS